MASRSPRDDSRRSAETTRIRQQPPHPGQTNYPADPPGGRARRYDGASGAYLPPRTHNPHLPPLTESPTRLIDDEPGTDRRRDGDYTPPEKVTVVRVMAQRSRYFTARGISLIRRAATADGADRSGLTALTMPVIINYAVDAAMAVALANTLFFAAATGDSKGRVGLYLALTVAPFAIIAPLIGPLLDRLQHGRRLAMAATFGLRALLALLIILNSSWDPVTHQLQYKPWILYPCALGLMVLSKSFGVLKSAVTPRVLPPSIDLVRVNSRLTMFGLVFGTVVAGALAAFIELVLGTWMPIHIPGAMLFLLVLAVAGAYFCMKIPARVEVTAGEIPTTITYRDRSDAAATGGETAVRSLSSRLAETIRQPLGRTVVTGLWGNGTIRVLTGFLTIYVAFYARAQPDISGWAQLMMLGAVGAAAGVGNAIGNGIGTRLQLKRPPRIIVLSAAGAWTGALLTAIVGSLTMMVVATFIAAGVSAIAKVCLDSTIQDGLPEASRASAFGRSETVLQLCWVLGASLGVLLPTTLWIGFTVVTTIMTFGLAQTVLTSRGATLVPGMGGRRPADPAPTAPLTVPDATDRPSARPTRPQPRSQPRR